jgi:hypothetical protein
LAELNGEQITSHSGCHVCDGYKRTRATWLKTIKHSKSTRNIIVFWRLIIHSIKKYTHVAKPPTSKVHGKKHICHDKKNHLLAPAFQHKKSPKSNDKGLF